MSMLGHNQPPLAERLEIDHADLVKRAKEAGDMVPAQVRAIASEEEAAAYTETVVGLKEVMEAADAAFEAEKKPWREGGNTVDKFFRFRAALDAATKRVRDALDRYQSEKLAAARREQADQERRDREAAAVFGGEEPARPAPPPTVAPVVSFSGAKASGSIRWDYRVADAAKVPREYLMVNDPAIRAAIAGIKAQGTKVEDAKIPGLEIFEAVRTAIRR